MAEKDFLLPDLGEGLTEGEIVSWLVGVGDVVEVDQPVAEVETAKAVVEVPSPFAGTITALHAEVGEEVEVGKPLLTIAVGAPTSSGEAPAEADAAVEADDADQPAGEPGEAPAEAETSDMVPGAADAGSGSVLVGYGTGGRRSRRRRARPTTHPSGVPLAKPPVRKLAKDLGVDLRDVEGSGPGGIVTRDDVEAFAGNGHGAPAPQDAPAEQAPTAADAERRPLKGVRKAIAERMAQSRREIPEAVTWVDADATDLMRVHADLAAAHPDVKLTPFALILRACVAALKRFPEVNASLDAERQEIVIAPAIHLGVAVQTDAGLMVPVIKDADGLTTLELAGELGRLATAARERTIGTAELQGSTFSVSNFGAFGVDGGDPVINHPNAAILGVGRIADKPWVVDGALAVRKVVQLSIAFDHRICDGAEAGGFLRALADLVESPARLIGEL